MAMRRCRHCRAEIPPKAASDHWQRVGFCDVEHMAAHGLAKAKKAHARKQAQEEAKARKARREAKERIKPRSAHMKEAQAAFNEWIRERDYDKPCISCGRFHEGQWHAGHYRTVGANPELRFEPLNCHRQCAPCNSHKSGDIVNYRINLVQRIGAEAVEWLEGPHPARKWAVEDLKAAKSLFRRLAREMKKERGA